MEESISKAAGAMHGEYVSPGQLQSLILSTGRTPAERSTTYKILRTPDADHEHDYKGRGVPTMRAMTAD
jgi:2-iminoacetate synthase ThiH